MAGVLSSLKQGFFDHTRKVSPNLFVCPGGWQISCQRDSGSLPKPAGTFIWLWPRLCFLHRFEYFPGFAGRSVLLFGWSEKLLPGDRIYGYWRRPSSFTCVECNKNSWSTNLSILLLSPAGPVVWNCPVVWKDYDRWIVPTLNWTLFTDRLNQVTWHLW